MRRSLRHPAHDRTATRGFVWSLGLAAALACVLSSRLVAAPQQAGRFLAREDIVLLGIGLQAAPADQTVPVNIATIVSTFLQSPTTLPEGVPPFAPDAVVTATLRGPSFPSGLDLTTKPNTPFNIPPLGVPGLHTLDNIRLVSGGSVLLYAAPESVTINVIDKLLVTQVTARPLTADEIRQKGIVFDKSSFQAYNFAAAFAIQDQTINISFPVVLPTLQSAATVSASTADVATIPPLTLPTLQTIIPDTLKIQTQVPNLSVVGFTLNLPSLQGKNLVVPPIPGVIVIPGNIGFLNQFFSVMLMVGNVAPTGSNLVVTDLQARLALPPGADQVLGSSDDPLRMARTANGDSPSAQPVAQPGPDGQLGTADDVASLGPGQTGQAEFLVEGLREGTHTIDIQMTGTLNGLPVGPVPISGSAVGAVLVRNPKFTLTFTHPDAVQAGEQYTLDVTVSNTSTSPANFVSLSLLPQNISGATIVGDSTQQIDSIAPADSATVHFTLVSKVSGKVTAATLDSDENVAGRFLLKASVGELGVPTSPDSLVLPSQASALPESLRDAAIGLLGKAWAVATAPVAALPADITRFSQKIVLDRGVQVAEAGFRVSLHEPIADSALQLEMDLAGSDAGRLPTVYPNASDLSVAQADFPAFDNLRRLSVRGDVLAGAVADLLAPNLASQGVAQFHQAVAQKIAYRPGSLSVVIGDAGGPLPFDLTLLDAAGNQIGGSGGAGKVLKQIPYGDYLAFHDGAGGTIGEMALVSAPAPGAFTIRLDAIPEAALDTPFTLSVVIPGAGGGLRQIVFQGVTAANLPSLTFAPDAPYTASVIVNVGSVSQTGSPLAAASDGAVVEPLPTVIGVVQQWQADVVSCPDVPPLYPGRVIAVLFNKEVTADSAQDGARAQNITNYAVDNNAVVGVALQPGHRIAFLALRDPVGPYIQRQLTVSGVADARGGSMASQSLPIETTVTAPGAVVSGRLLQADGTPISYGNARLFYVLQCEEPQVVGISSKNADVNGQYSWDYVLQNADQIAAVDPESGQFRTVYFTPARAGQRLNVDVVLLGRGTLQGRTLAQDGATPLPATSIRVTSLTDQSQYSATSDDQGRFTIAKIPVGNIVIEAVNVAAKAQITLSDLISVAGGTLTRDLALVSVQQTQVTIQHGTLTGHVFRSDGSTPAAGLTTIAYYENASQPGVTCPGAAANVAGECAVAVTTTDSAGAYAFASIIAGAIRISTFDQATLEQGGAQVVVPANGAFDATVLLTGGLGTVHGTVLDASGTPIAGARVGGGLSLTTSDASGQFTLADVPVGHRTIVAVSDQLGSRGQADIDLVHDGDTVNVTLVLNSVAAVAGTVFRADGVTPVPNNKVYLFASTGGGSINVVGTATTDQAGHYTFGQVPLGDYTVSAFTSDFSDGNLVKVALKFSGQTLKADIRFRDAGGRVTGAVYDADGQTPLEARVGISADQVVVAGGLIGAGFQRVQNFAIVDTDPTTGQFAFGGLWTGDFTIAAVGQFSPDPISLNGTIPTPGAAVQMNLRLQGTSRISGTVFQPDGVTPAGANVVIGYHSDAFKTICDDAGACTTIPQGVQEENVVTDANGQYVLPVVNAGTFTLTATDPTTGKTAQLHGSVRAGQEVDLPVRLLGIGQLTVKVLASDAVTPIPGAKVELWQTDYPTRHVTLFADPTGTASFTGGDAIGEGTFVVAATDVRNGLSGRASGKITSDGQQLTLTVYLYTASGSVHGTVFRPDGVTPVPNADVVISGAGGPLAYTVTDGSGSYSQDLLPLGPFTVEVFEAATARQGTASGSIDLDKQQVPANVVLGALGLVKGTVLASGSLEPIVGAIVHLGDRLPSGRFLSLVTTTGTDGTFSFPGVALGSFTISLTVSKDGASGTGTAQGAIASEGQVLDIPIVVDLNQPLFGTIQGTTFNADGSAAPNVEVAVQCPNCPFPDGRTVTSGPDGRFVLDHVQTGRFVIRAASQVAPNIGAAAGQLTFDGEIADVPIVLSGLGQVNGTVVLSGGQPAPGAQVALTSLVALGQLGDRTVFADAQGNFAFANVASGLYRVTASDPVTGLKGAVSGTLRSGEAASVRIVLQPSGSLHGRALFASGAPAAGVTADLKAGTQELFASTAGDGTFTFDGVALVPYTLTLQDPIGPGVARRTGTLTGPIELGDVVLNDTIFAVSSTLPAASAVGVPLNQAIQITFDEPVDFGTVNAASVSLIGPAGPLQATLATGSGGTAVTLTPISPLKDGTPYSVRVTGVTDAVGKPLASDYVFSFTTADITPPTVVDLTPAPNLTGVALAATVRVQFSEPINPAKFTGQPLTLSGPSGSVGARLDYLFGNTVLVLTPLQPLQTGTTYHVVSQPATDLSGNVQAQSLDYTFVTTTLTPPAVLSLTAAHSPVIEGTAATVTAAVGQQDVAFVDFYLNDVFAASVRSAPFTFQFLANANLGHPGDQIKVSAIATDTSGLRGQTPAVAFVAVAADQPPAVTITAPADGAKVHNGDRVSVTVHAADDVGVAQVGYKAVTGRPQDAGAKTLDPTSLDDSETFAFNVPTDAVPGSSIVVQASGVDTRGQATQAQVTVTVLDSVGPTVAITGATTGSKVTPGQQTTVVVSAQDAGGVASIAFAASGAASFAQTRTINPTQGSAVTSFTFTVASTAQPGDSVTLTASATDAAGNTGAAASVLLPVADSLPPRIHLRTGSGSLDVPRGSTVSVIADVDDETAVARIDLTGSGAMTFADSQAVSPPAGSTSVVFEVAVPATLQPGQVINLQATAVDTSSNVSLPSTLNLTVESLPTVLFPSSALLVAGDSQNPTVQLSDPAPAGGLTVSLASADPTIASVDPASATVVFAEGESSKTFTLSGVSGGTTSITGQIQGIERGSMTVTVRGGIVSGTVLDPQLNPVAGAQVTVGQLGVVTDASGNYFIEGYAGPSVSVKALDPTSQLLGMATGVMNRQNGFVHINVVLLAAGTIDGTVVQADGQTPAAAGAKVQLFSGTNTQTTPVATTFTDTNGAYSFPLVAVGSYTIDASDAGGNHGRATATLAATGQTLTVPVTYLGRGTVTGSVLDGNDNPVPNAALTLRVVDAFGPEPTISVSAASDGTFSFPGVFVGTFTITAQDPVSGQGGTTTGQVASNAQAVTATVHIASSANIAGTVFRADGVTPVPGATVSLTGQNGSPGPGTTADDQGRYTFAFVPLGTVHVTARDVGSRGIGSADATLSVNGATVTADITMLAQGSIVATVVDSSGTPVVGAQVNVFDQFSPAAAGQTSADGTVVIGNVNAGAFTIEATSANLTGNGSGTLAAGEVRQVTVMLQAVASIAGTVFAPDGQTPVSDAQVLVFTSGTTALTARVNSDGTFRFDNLPLGTYPVEARDTTNRTRARATVSLTANGQVADTTLTYVGAGNVTGRVLNPDGSSAAGLSVQVQSLNAGFGGFFPATTNAAGLYEADGVPVGAFGVSTGDPARQLLGEGSGTIAQDGQVVNVDILLQSNALALPYGPVYDANNFSYSVQQDASNLNGYLNMFDGDQAANRGAPLLDLVVGGVANRFTGSNIGTFENHQQSIAVRQSVAGLNVTRKVFVPTTGYFARYLEILSNPSTDPVTVDVRVTSNLKGYSGPVDVIGTSSGDATLSVADAGNPDRWVVLDDTTDNDPPVYSYGVPAVAAVFDGPGAATRVSAATLTSLAFPAAQLVHVWSNVTVPPGGTVAFMYFLSQETSRAVAAGAAARLDQLPPEALSGLSPAEVQEIRNFAVPADGIGSVAPIGVLTSVVTGRVLDVDGTTPLASAPVTLTSNDLVFSRTRTATTNVNGQFTFTGVLGSFANSVAIPADAFTLQARHPASGVLSQLVAGSFPAGQTATTQDVVFTTTATIKGTVHRISGALVTSGSVNVSGTNLTAAIKADGTFVLSGVQPGLQTLVASIPSSLGTALAGSTTATIPAGQVTTVDITMPATGSVAVLVSRQDGTPSSGTSLILRNSADNFRRSGTTDATGSFTFADVPSDTYLIDYTEPRTRLAATSAAFAVAQDQTASEHLTVIAVGSVQVHVSFASGAAAAGSIVYLSGSASNSLTTDAAGNGTFTNVPAGAFGVQARHPNNQTLYAQGNGSIVNEGDAPSISLTLPAAGAVSGHVTFGTGSSSVGSQVAAWDVTRGAYIQSVYTDAGGNYSFGGIPAGTSFVVRFFRPYPYSNLYREVPAATIAADGQVQTIDGVVPALATVRVTVLQTNGTPLVGARIEWQDVAHTAFQFGGYTDANGQLSIANVQEGAFSINVRDPNTFLLLNQTVGTVRPSDEASIVDVAVQLTNPQGTVQGTVFAADGTTPAPGMLVQVYDGASGAYLRGTTTGPDGSYQFANVQTITGAFTVYAYTPSGLTSVSQSGQFVTDGQVVAMDFTLPVLQGSVQGVVFGVDGATPLPGAYVKIVDSSTSSFLTDTSADANGAFQFTNVWLPTTGFLVQAYSYDNTSVVGSQAGSITAQGQTVQLNVTVPIVSGSVAGTVHAGDGLTGVPGARVEVYDQAYLDAGGEGGFYFSADTLADGTYAVPSFSTDATTGFYVDVTAPNGAFAEQQATFSTVGQQAVINFTLPLSVVKGQLKFDDGTVPDQANATVFLLASDGGTYYGTILDAQDDYVVLGAPVGAITVTGQDRASGLTTSASATIASVDAPTMVDLTLSGGGTVTGQVIGLDGNPVFNATVVLQTQGLSFQRYTTTDASGRFTFGHVAIGTSSLQASWTDTQTRFASATAVVTSDGQAVDVTLSASSDGQVSGHVLASDGTALPNANVTVESYGSYGPLGHFSATTTADGTGSFTMAGVPPGPIHVLAVDPANSQNLGVSDGSLAGPSVVLDVTMGTGTRFVYNLDGTDGWRYDVDADGSLQDGGAANRSVTDAYDGAYHSVINGTQFASVTSGRLELSSRQVVLGPLPFGGLLVTRKIFSPAAGGFARYLEIVSNPTGTDQSVTVAIQSNLGSDSNTRVYVTPASTGNTYAVTDQNGICCDPTLGHVFSGVTPPVPPASVSFADHNDSPSYSWQLTVPANGTVIIMHFGLERLQNALIATSNAAAALRDLTDPNALVGMTAEEKAAVRNFVVPQ
ncbi:MAG: carboxypeptidase regulatory-like domain-containing protein [Betaproteobacteria bacterium]